MAIKESHRQATPQALQTKDQTCFQGVINFELDKYPRNYTVELSADAADDHSMPYLDLLTWGRDSGSSTQHRIDDLEALVVVVTIGHLVYESSCGDVGQSRSGDIHDRYHYYFLRRVMFQIIALFFEDHDLGRCQPKVARVIARKVLSVVEQEWDHDN